MRRLSSPPARRPRRRFRSPASTFSFRVWGGVLKGAVNKFRKSNLTDRAAALTYYSVLSLFPALIALVGVLGLVGQNPETTDALLRIIRDIGPDSAAGIYKAPIESVLENKGGAGIALVIGLLVALWSASSYIGAFTRASNDIYGVVEDRPFWKVRPLQLLVTLGLVLSAALVGLALVLTGPLADAVAKPIGLGDAAVTAWSFAKWPVLLALAMAGVGILYYSVPGARRRGFRWVTPGSLLAVLVWILASAGFAFYVANFGSYNKTYGSLGGVIIFLVWLWISNVAVLLGVVINAEIEAPAGLDAQGHADSESNI
jgi:membrane protein